MFFGTRKYRFEIARQLVKNGKIEYHGRNCVLLVEICGSKNEKSHMIMDLGDLDTAMKNILTGYDHTTKRVPFERIAQSLFLRLKMTFPMVWRMTLYEDDNTFYELQKFDIGDTMKVTRGYDFSAAHRTHNPNISEKENKKIYGKCNTLHGHQYRLEVTIAGEVDRDTGYVIDPDTMNINVLNTINHYHNQILNEVHRENYRIFEGNATTENFIEALWKELEPKFDTDNYRLFKLRLHETDRNYFDFQG